MFTLSNLIFVIETSHMFFYYPLLPNTLICFLLHAHKSNKHADFIYLFIYLFIYFHYV